MLDTMDDKQRKPGAEAKENGMTTDSDMGNKNIDRLLGELGQQRLGRRAFLRRAMATGLSLPAASALFAACGSSTPTAKQTSSTKPRHGGTLLVAGSDPGLLNPAITSSGATHPVTGQLFNGLVRLYTSNFDPRPDLARSWDISKDGLTYTFHLHQGVKWHDGQPFSSTDVKYTYENVLLKLHPRTRQLKPIISQITTPDTNTVVFRLAFAYPPFLKWLDEDNGAILPQHLYQGTNPLQNPANNKPVGTGPFVFKSAIQGNQYTLARNPHYFKPGLPYLDQLVFRVIPPAEALQGFQAGEVGLLPDLGPTGPRLLQGRPDVTVTKSGRDGFALVVRLIPNMARKPFDDLRVRQAIAYAIDRPFIAQTAYGGTLQPATGPISAAFQPWYTDNVMKFTRDPAKANMLLDQAGLKPNAQGERLATSLIFDQGFARTAQLLKQELGQVGITLNLQLMDFNAWVNKLYIQKDFDLGYSQLTGPADPDIGVKRLFLCSNIAPVPFSNGESYCNPQLDALFMQAAREIDQHKRIGLYDQIQQTIVRDEPQIFLVGGISPWAWSNKFSGIDRAGSKSPYYFGETTYSTTG